jgi:GNAT superfamily N-acetyltransferase
MARAVHELDGYPVYLPTDLRTFLVVPDAYGAWVAEEAGAIVGHVALHRTTTAAALARAAAAVERPVEGLGVVARLLVDPVTRRRGAGRALLERAAREAVARDLWPVLDVVTGLDGAVGLYERCGWTCVGQVTVRLGGEFSCDELVFVGPGRAGQVRTRSRTS